ncbi:MAG: hypothetical protein AAGH42_01095 [Pseudomonadota bacterium]
MNKPLNQPSSPYGSRFAQVLFNGAGAALLALGLFTLRDALAKEETLAIFDLAAGVWELDPAETADRADFVCGDNPLRISFSEDRRTYKADLAEERFAARILEAKPSYLLIQYGDEDRFDADGKPVKWYLHILDTDHFFWVRDDWLDNAEGGRTPLRRRCPPEDLSS